MRATTVAVVLFCCALARPALAAECRVPKNSNEARLLGFYSAPISFSPASAPEPAEPWTIRLGAEGGLIPDPDTAIQHSGTCFTEKSENTKLSPFFGRPRLTLTLPAGFAVEASYLPPIKIHDAEPNLGSAAISWTRRLKMASTGNSTDIMFRLHGTVGHVRGPITCPESALQQTDQTNPCFGTRPSLDTFSPTMVGIEGILSTAAFDGRVAFYAGGGQNFLRPRFQVGFTNGLGSVDSTLIVVDLTRITMFGGLSAEVSEAIDLSAQVYDERGDGITFRVGAGYRIHR